MADYGLKIFDSGGNVTLDLTDRITRLRYSVIATAGVSDSIVLSDIDGKNTCEFGIEADDVSVPGLSHLVSRSGTTISWTYRGTTIPGDPFPSCNTLVLVFLWD